MDAAALAEDQQLHRRALRLEWFTISWNVVEAVVAISAGLIAGSVALVGFGVDSGIEVISDERTQRLVADVPDRPTIGWRA